MPQMTTVYYGSARPPFTNKTRLMQSTRWEADGEKPRAGGNTLSILRTLYAITTASLDVTEVTQRIVDAITKELNVTFVLLALRDKKTNLLRPVAITRAPEIRNAVEIIGKPLPDITISMEFQLNAMVHAIRSRQRQSTGNFLDVLTPEITQKIADKIADKINIKSFIVYPLLISEKTLGAMTVGSVSTADEPSPKFTETLEQLVDVISIAIERAELHEDLRMANLQLQELDKLKDEFVSLASHELRTPMTGIRGSLATILEGYAGEITPAVKEFLTAAYNENDRLIRLVNNLLNISRIEAGRFTFTKTRVDLDKLIQEVVKNLEMAAQEKNLYLRYEKTMPLPFVYADSDKVEEVLVNLIGNAIKYTHKGGVTVSASVKGKLVIIAVTDTGSGIANEDMERLFKKFSQVGGNYARPTGGTGLGLYICKQIVEGLQGKIWLDSTLGKGSTFYFSLPTAE